MRASKLLSAAAAAIVLSAALPAQAKESLPTKNPWRDSEIAYEHATTAIGFDNAADPDDIDVWVHRLSLTGYWHATDFLYFRAKLDMEQELVENYYTSTQYRHEVQLADLQIDIASKGITEPYTGIKLGGGVRASFPTSKASQAATMRFSVGPGINLSRKFAVLEGLTIGYGGRFNFFNHRFTQPVPSQGANGYGSVRSDPSSTSEVNSTSMAVGRNAWMSIAQGPTIAFEPYSGLTLDLGYLFLYGMPYGLSKDESSSSNVDDSVQKVRFAEWFTASIAYAPLDYLSVAFNVSTLSGTLRPDAKTQDRFFNRDTQLSLSLTLSIDPLVSKFQ